MPAARSLCIPGPIDVPHYFSDIWLQGLGNVCTQESFARTGDVQSVSSQALPLQEPLGHHPVWCCTQVASFGHNLLPPRPAYETKHHVQNDTWEMWLWFDPMEINHLLRPYSPANTYRPFSFFTLRPLISYTIFCSRILSQNFILYNSRTSIVGTQTRPQVRRSGVWIPVWVRDSSLQHLTRSLIFIDYLG